MADIAKRMVGPLALPTAPAEVYAASMKAVMRSIHVANETGVEATFTLAIGVDGAGKRLYKGFPVPGNGTFDWSGFSVLEAGDVLQASANTPAALTLTVSGFETTV